MTEHYDRQYMMKRKCMLKVNDIFYFASVGRYTHTMILLQLKGEIYEQNSYRRLTNYNKGYVDCTIDHAMKEHYKLLAWCHRHPDVNDGRWTQADKFPADELWRLQHYDPEQAHQHSNYVYYDTLEWTTPKEFAPNGYGVHHDEADSVEGGS